jgi:hypothetical protein
MASGQHDHQGGEEVWAALFRPPKSKHQMRAAALSLVCIDVRHGAGVPAWHDWMTPRTITSTLDDAFCDVPSARDGNVMKHIDLVVVRTMWPRLADSSHQCISDLAERHTQLSAACTRAASTDEVSRTTQPILIV